VNHVLCRISSQDGRTFVRIATFMSLNQGAGTMDARTLDQTLEHYPTTDTQRGRTLFLPLSAIRLFSPQAVIGGIKHGLPGASRTMRLYDQEIKKLLNKIHPD